MCAIVSYKIYLISSMLDTINTSGALQTRIYGLMMEYENNWKGFASYSFQIELFFVTSLHSWSHTVVLKQLKA